MKRKTPSTASDKPEDHLSKEGKVEKTIQRKPPALGSPRPMKRTRVDPRAVPNAVEKFLLGKENFSALKKAIKENGFWHIPEKIKKQLLLLFATSNELINKVIENDTEIPAESKEAKEIFSSSELIVEKFCFLKISEIKFFLRKGTMPRASSDIIFSFLEHTGDQGKVNVNIIQLHFCKNNLAKTIVKHNGCNSGEYKNVLHSLQQSQWLTTFPNATIIRFSDRNLNTKLSIKIYCEKVDYVVTSSEMKIGNKQPNFWENLAIKNKSKELAGELFSVDIFKQNFERRFEGIDSKEIKLESSLKGIASFQGDIDQAEYVEKVLRNQMVGLGSLLYLPTGFGKTFIILLAMAQHYSNLSPEFRKPYLIVIPKNNLRDSWEDNIRIFISELKKRGIENDFSKAFPYEGDELKLDRLQYSTTETFHNYIKQCKGKIIKEPLLLITKNILTLEVKKILVGKKPNGGRVANNLGLLKKSDILLGDDFIIGHDKQDWEKRIKKTLNFMLVPEELEIKLKNFIDHNIPLDENNKMDSFFENPSNSDVFLKKIDDEIIKYLINEVKKNSYFEKNDNLEITVKNVFSYLKYSHELKKFLNLESNRDLRRKINSIPDITVDKLFERISNEQNRKIKIKKGDKEDKSENLINAIEILAKEQLESSEEYQNFINMFSGLIIDESQMLLVTDSKNDINITDIVLEISELYQADSKINNKENRLIIAASATPWPNDLEEIKQHFELLAAGIIKENAILVKNLFSAWEKFEDKLKKNSGSHLPGHISGEKISPEDLDNVTKKLYPWLKAIFDKLVLYKEKEETTNQIEEKMLYINFEETTSRESWIGNKTNDQKDLGSGLKEIANFYSHLLSDYLSKHKTTHRKNQKSKKSDGSDHLKEKDVREYIETRLREGKNNELLEQFLSIIKNNTSKKIGIYITEHEDAAFLKHVLNYFYFIHLKIPNIEIGFFYEETFVKKQAENKNRKVNKNAFNNQFDLHDYQEFIRERFRDNTKQHNHLLKFIHDKDKEDFFGWVSAIYQLFKRRKKSDNTQEVPTIPKTGKKNFSEISRIYEALEKKIHEPLVEKIIGSCYPEKEKKKEKLSLRNFFDFMDTLIDFSEKSSLEIIDFETSREGDSWLSKFTPFLLPNCAPHSLNPIEKLTAFREKMDDLARDQKGNESRISDNFFETMQYSIIYYIHKIYLSRVLIFGDAGISGMRVDADILFIFSGAWTEGKLTQIRGRVGRLKPVGPARKCQIYSPVTNTIFEYFILKYYIIKFIYNKFIVSPEVMPGDEICRPLLLSHAFYSHYVNKSVPFIDKTITDKIHKLEKEGIIYSSLPPFEKAQHIMLAQFKEMLDKISGLIHEVKFNGDIKNREIINPPYLAPLSAQPNPIERQDNAVIDLTSNTEGSDLKGHIPEDATRSLIIPTIKPHQHSNWTDADRTVIDQFYTPSAHHFILMLPTRGKRPDLDVIEFSRYIYQSYQKYRHHVKIFLLFGINSDNEPQLEEIIKHSEKMLTSRASEQTNTLFIKMIPFTWQQSDKRGNKIPLGQMRNFCFERCRELWEYLVNDKKLDCKNISLISMDGDTELTSGCFDKIFNLRNSLINLFMSFGYEIRLIDTAGKHQEITKYSPTQDSNKEKWLDYWTALASHISMNVNSFLKSQSNFYYGYPAEPLIYINSRLLNLFYLSSGRKRYYLAEDARSEFKAVFGFWDKEGRRLLRTMKNICDEYKEEFFAYGPSEKISERPILHYFDRFKFHDFPIRKIKQQLHYEELIQVIARISSQTQNSFRPYFTASNIAHALKIETYVARQISAYYYINNFVILLKLGPMRSYNFAGFIRDECSLADTSRYSPITPDELKEFEATTEQLKQFVRQNFYYHMDGQPKELFVLLSKWARKVAHQLMSWFQRDYIGERQETTNRYLPIELPDNYPKRAADYVAEEDKKSSGLDTEFAEKNRLNLDVISEEIHQYLIDYIDYADYSKKSKKAQELLIFSNQLKFFGISGQRYIIVILTHDNENIGTSTEKILLILQKLYKESTQYVDLIALSIYQQNDKCILIKSTLELEKDKNHGELLSLEAIKEHCPSLNKNFGSMKIRVGSRLNARAVYRTKGEGDCAFHAVLGEWDEKTQEYRCENVPEQRRKVAKAIRGSRPPMRVYELAVEGIKAYVMGMNPIGTEIRQLIARYRGHVEQTEAELDLRWDEFYSQLSQQVAIVQYIKRSHGLPEGSNTRLQFFQVLNHAERGDTLRGLVMSLSSLEKQFRQYSELAQQGFNWEVFITPAVVNEYAAIIEKPGQWLLPLELQLIAEVMSKTIIFYSSRTAKPIPYNPDCSTSVHVQFSFNHYERASLTPDSLSSSFHQNTATPIPACLQPLVKGKDPLDIMNVVEALSYRYERSRILRNSSTYSSRMRGKDEESYEQVLREISDIQQYINTEMTEKTSAQTVEHPVLSEMLASRHTITPNIDQSMWSQPRSSTSGRTSALPVTASRATLA